MRASSAGLLSEVYVDLVAKWARLLAQTVYCCPSSTSSVCMSSNMLMMVLARALMHYAVGSHQDCLHAVCNLACR